MVTLALSAIGALSSSALGLGPGVGFAAGSLIGNVIGNRGNSQVIQGARLRDLTVQDSAVGKPIPILYGACRVSGELMWVFNGQVREIEIRQTDTVGGKGGGQKVTQVSYEYRADFAIGLGAGPIVGVNRIWFDSTLVYGAVPSDVPDLSPAQDQPRGSEFVSGKGNTPGEDGPPLLAPEKFRLYRGTEDQTPDPLIEEDIGAGLVPAYRGLAYIVFSDIDVTPFGGRIPNVSVEIGASRRRWLGLGFEAIPLPPDPIVTDNGATPLSPWPETIASGGQTPKLATLDTFYEARLATDDAVYSDGVIRYRNFVARYDKQDGYLHDSHELNAESPDDEWLTHFIGDSLAPWNTVTSPRQSSWVGPPAAYPYVSIRAFSGAVPYSNDAMALGLLNHLYLPVMRSYYVDTGAGIQLEYDVALMRINAETGGFRLSEWTNLGSNGTPALYVWPNRDGQGELVYLTAGYPPTLGSREGAGRVLVYASNVTGAGAGAVQLLADRDLNSDYGIKMLSHPYPGEGCQTVQTGLSFDDDGTPRNHIIKWQDTVPYIQEASQLPPNLIHTYSSNYEGYPPGFALYRPNEIWFDEYTDSYYAVGAAARGNTSYPFFTSNPEAAQYPSIPTNSGTQTQRARADALAVGNLYKLDKSFGVVGQIDGIAHERQEQAAIQGSLNRFGHQYIGGDVTNPNNMVVHDVDLEAMTLLSSVESTDPDPDGIGDDEYGPIVSNQFVHSPHKQGAYWWTSQGISFPDLYGTTGETTLADIVADISVRAGLAPTDFDVSELTDIVIGATLPRRDTAANHLVQFMMAYFFDPCEEDWIIKYKKRNRASSATIPLNDLAAGAPGDRAPSMRETIPAETQLPRKINVQIIDRWRDYQPNDAQAWRDQTVVITAHQTTAEMSIVFNGLDEPRGIAKTMLDELYNAHLFELSVGPKWSTIGPGDVITVTHVGATTIMRALAVDRGADMTIKIQAVRHDQSIYGGSVAGGQGFFIASSLPPLVPAEIMLLDVPAIRDCDVANVALTGFAEANFLAVMGASGAPATATLYRDNNPGLEPLLAFSKRSIIGRCENKLPSASAAVVDTTSALRVKLTNPDDALESVSIAQAIDWRNAALVGSETAGWELITFASAVEGDDGVWTLTNLTRGGRGTDYWIDSHAIGDRFILLEPSRVQRVDIEFADIGVPISYRRVSGRQALTGPASTTFADNGNKLRPWAPALVTGAREA